MKKNNLLKISTCILGCLALVSIGGQCYNTQDNVAKQSIVETEDPIIFTEVSSYDTLYDFSDSAVLAEHSDLVVVGKLKEIGTPTNFNAKTKKYGKACTPNNLEIMQVIKSDDNQNLEEVNFLNIGGLISYSDYEKSLLPAQKAKREYLMQQNGTLQAKSNMFVKQSVKDQLEIEEDKTYIVYLYYNENYDSYMVVNQPYGIKEYNANTGKILNHVTNKVENLDELM